MAITSMGSGLDVASIVSQLMQIERQPLIRLDQREASYQARLSAYGSLSGALSNFQATVDGLTTPAALLGMKSVLSDSTVVSAQATATAAPGSYSIEVSRLAQQQKLVSGGLASADSAIGVGTLSIEFGSISGGSFDSLSGSYSGAAFNSDGAAPLQISVTSANNTLRGLRDAINAANAGVGATLINDGGTTPYRLAFTAKQSGALHSMRIVASGDAALGTLLGHDPAGVQALSQKSAAQDAAFTLDGVNVTKPTNSIDDALEGVTLNLLKVSGGTPVTLTVSRDATAAQKLAKGFVDAFNNFNKNLRALASYDSSSKIAGPLYADATSGAIASRMRAIVNASLSGVGAYTGLSQLGIGFQRDGSLALDAAKFQAAYAAAPTDLAAVFAQSGLASDALVSYAGASELTQAGSHALSVSQIATRAALSGSAPPALSIVTGVNDTLEVGLDGQSVSVTLGAAVYASAEALARAVQSAINANATLSGAGAALEASVAGNAIALISKRYGALSAVSIGGNGATDLLGATPQASVGSDVAGTLGGVAGVGVGQTLQGFGGSPTDGLRVLVNGGASGGRGSVRYAPGLAYQLNRLAQSLLDPAGPIANRTGGINTSIKGIGKQRDDLAARLTLVEARYRRQYATLDGVLSRMQSTQNYLTTQFQALANLTSGR